MSLCRYRIVICIHDEIRSSRDLFMSLKMCDLPVLQVTSNQATLASWAVKYR